MGFLFRIHKKSTISLEKSPFLIVGLGNPGIEYRNNRHNVGFMVLDRLASSMGIKFAKYQFKALVGFQLIDDQKCIIAKPQTFMNLSGVSVASILKFYKVTEDHLMVIHDDIDLPLGMIRLRSSGSSAGQKGMESIILRLKTQDFPRLRIGIGRPSRQRSAANYVLADFIKAEKTILDGILNTCVEAIKTFIQCGIDTAMNRYNGENIRK
jgi:PTH1 family peptidyl-tRNA hydrolase